MSDQLRVAVIGAGIMGSNHARVLKQLPSAQLVAVVDADIERARLAGNHASIAALTKQQRSNDFSSDEPPLIRGGSESVYLVTTHRAAGLSWRQAAPKPWTRPKP